MEGVDRVNGAFGRANCADGRSVADVDDRQIQQHPDEAVIQPVSQQSKPVSQAVDVAGGRRAARNCAGFRSECAPTPRRPEARHCGHDGA